MSDHVSPISSFRDQFARTLRSYASSLSAAQATQSANELEQYEHHDVHRAVDELLRIAAVMDDTTERKYPGHGLGRPETGTVQPA